MTHKKRKGLTPKERARMERHFQAVESEALLRRAVKKWGLRWLIAHYQCAIINWNWCLDEVLELRKKVERN